MTQELGREALSELLRAEHVEPLSARELVVSAREEISDFLPDGVYEIDPRNGDRILYHSSRGTRPHDNVLESRADIPVRECAICRGETTQVVDVAELSEGFTFVNQNLFPILYPFEGEGLASGLHFLQWTSSQHDKDWHNMPLCDLVVVMERLAALERVLLDGSGGLPLVEHLEDVPDDRGFVLIVKNYGHLVGGSLTHGHQQVAFSNVMPRRFRDNWLFRREHGEPFSAYLLRENPSDLVVKDYGPASLVVPYFMRRPYDMALLVKDATSQYLHQLSQLELEAVAEGWRDGIRAIHEIMPKMGREIAYNVIINNGPGAGLYVEFLPYTQEIGGVEHLGLIVCQELPERAAVRLREVVLQRGETCTSDS
ncbi:MAG: hypothetical protein PVF54_08940 [Anaerolineae bacterium]|jgi:galactose-1-phosphate uridylyltransferase